MLFLLIIIIILNVLKLSSVFSVTPKVWLIMTHVSLENNLVTVLSERSLVK